jgi:osmotically-inducible protein OsmY
MPMTRSDRDILHDIQLQLARDASVDANNVQVEVKNGRVNITGIVTDYEAYQSVLRDTWMVRGVIAVMDRLRIEYPVGTDIPTDTEIRNRILNVLEWSTSIDAARIDVEVMNGIASLNGSVDAYWQRERAENLAFTVAGVLKVNNNLAVVLEADVADEQIRNDLFASFRRVLYLDADRIDVAVRNGFVTLSGFVPDWFAYRTASDIACRAAGVRGITNTLQIGTSVGV